MERTGSPYVPGSKINMRGLTSPAGRPLPPWGDRVRLTEEIHRFSAGGQVTGWQVQFPPKHRRRNGTRASFSKLLVTLVSDEINLVRIQQAY